MSRSVPPLVLVIVLVGGSTSWTSTLRAQPPEQDELVLEAHARARDLFERGVTAFDEGDYDRALELFRRSYAIRPAPLVLYNIAVTERHLGRHAEAIRHLTRYLEETENVDARREVVRSELDEISSRMGRLVLEVEPEGAEVHVDEVLVEQGAEPLWLSPGPHRVRVSAPGHRTSIEEIELAPGRRHVHRVALGYAAPPAVVTAHLAPPPREAVSLEAIVDIGATPAEEGRGSDALPWVLVGVGVVAAAILSAWLVAEGGTESVEGNFDPPVVTALRMP